MNCLDVGRFRISGLLIGILKHDKIGYAEQRLIEIGRSRGHVVEIINPLNIVLGDGVLKYDVIISRAEINSFREDVTDAYFRLLEYFESIGVPVINSARSLLISQDKFRTHFVMRQNNISVPNSVLVHGIKSVWNSLKGQIRYPFVIKKPYGGRGEGVFVINNIDELRKAEISFTDSSAVLVQDYIELETNEDGCFRDMRIWVCRDPETEIPVFLGGFYRNASSGSYLTNLSRNGIITPIINYDDNVIKMAETVLDAIGADVAGIDIARDCHGALYFLEANASFDTTQESVNAVGVDVWSMVMDLAENRTMKMM
ncbi:MAG: YheC/YheD family protein [Candidatus Aenigmatarchaeota archaeon]